MQHSNVYRMSVFYHSVCITPAVTRRCQPPPVLLAAALLVAPEAMEGDVLLSSVEVLFDEDGHAWKLL